MQFKSSAPIMGLQEVAPGVFMPLPLSVTYEGVEIEGALYVVEMVIDTTTKGIRPVSVKVVAPAGQAITSTELRAVRMGELWRDAILRTVTRGYSKATADDGAERADLMATGLSDQEVELIKLRGPVRESLEVAAWLYNVACVIGLPPAKEVERGLGLPRTTASKWIRRAREMGLITSTEGSADGEHQAAS